VPVDYTGGNGARTIFLAEPLSGEYRAVVHYGHGKAAASDSIG
jgi:hypothetical protein